jgi:hypothetical protein
MPVVLVVHLALAVTAVVILAVDDVRAVVDSLRALKVSKVAASRALTHALKDVQSLARMVALRGVQSVVSITTARTPVVVGLSRAVQSRAQKVVQTRVLQTVVAVLTLARPVQSRAVRALPRGAMTTAVRHQLGVRPVVKNVDHTL